MLYGIEPYCADGGVGSAGDGCWAIDNYKNALKGFFEGNKETTFSLFPAWVKEEVTEGEDRGYFGFVLYVPYPVDVKTMEEKYKYLMKNGRPLASKIQSFLHEKNMPVRITGNLTTDDIRRAEEKNDVTIQMLKGSYTVLDKQTLDKQNAYLKDGTVRITGPYETLEFVFSNEKDTEHINARHGSEIIEIEKCFFAGNHPVTIIWRDPRRGECYRYVWTFKSVEDIYGFDEVPKPGFISVAIIKIIVDPSSKSLKKSLQEIWGDYGDEPPSMLENIICEVCREYNDLKCNLNKKGNPEVKITSETLPSDELRKRTAQSIKKVCEFVDAFGGYTIWARSFGDGR